MDKPSEKNSSRRAALEAGLRTDWQRFTESRYNEMYIGKDLVTSPAWQSLVKLRTGVPIGVYMIFLTKRQMLPVQGKSAKKRKGNWYIANNGKIQFTYNEARMKWGLKDKQFTFSIDVLMDRGLIDITKTGFGLKKDVTLYAISERWKAYGTPDFIEVSRKKRPERLSTGFNKVNRQRKENAREKEHTTVASNCCATVVEDC